MTEKIGKKFFNIFGTYQENNKKIKNVHTHSRIHDMDMLVVHFAMLNLVPTIRVTVCGVPAFQATLFTQFKSVSIRTDTKIYETQTSDL